jgi:hypothetical protein
MTEALKALNHIVDMAALTKDRGWSRAAMAYVAYAVMVKKYEYITQCVDVSGAPQCWRNLGMRASNPMHLLDVPVDYGEIKHF